MITNENQRERERDCPGGGGGDASVVTGPICSTDTLQLDGGAAETEF